MGRLVAQSAGWDGLSLGEAKAQWAEESEPQGLPMREHQSSPVPEEGPPAGKQRPPPPPKTCGLGEQERLRSIARQKANEEAAQRQEAAQLQRCGSPPKSRPSPFGGGGKDPPTTPVSTKDLFGAGTDRSRGSPFGKHYQAGSGGGGSLFGGSGGGTPQTSTSTNELPTPAGESERESYDQQANLQMRWHKDGPGDQNLTLTLNQLPDGTFRGMNMLLGTKADKNGETKRACTQLIISFHRLWKDFVLDLQYALVPGRNCEKGRSENSVNFKFMACTSPLGELISTKGWTPQRPVGLRVEPKTPQHQ